MRGGAIVKMASGQLNYLLYYVYQNLQDASHLKLSKPVSYQLDLVIDTEDTEVNYDKILVTEEQTRSEFDDTCIW